MNKNTPNPGTSEAIALGCECPVVDNHHGRGYRGDAATYGFIKNTNCKVHPPDAKPSDVPAPDRR
jgi:hypothetical protein